VKERGRGVLSKREESVLISNGDCGPSGVGSAGQGPALLPTAVTCHLVPSKVAQW
jgi:hypothetical protein